MSTAISTAASYRESVDDYVQGTRRVMFVLLGSFFLLLGLVGIVVPGLPTTPFLLLASYFYSRSWPALHRKLLANSLFGPILRDWQEKRGVSRRVKLGAIGTVTVAVSVCLFVSSMPIHICWFVVFLAMIGLVVVAKLPGIDSSEK